MADTEIDRETAIRIAEEEIQALTNTATPEALSSDKYIAPFVEMPHGHFATTRLLELQKELELNGGSTPGPRFHDEAVGYAEAMLRLDIHLPSWLADFVADVLKGYRTRPQKPGPQGENRLRTDQAIYSAATKLVHEYGLPRYSNNPAEPDNYLTAFQAVAEAAHRQGVNRPVSQYAVKRIWKKMTTQN